jgi:hypothetical protein
MHKARCSDTLGTSATAGGSSISADSLPGGVTSTDGAAALCPSPERSAAWTLVLADRPSGLQHKPDVVACTLCRHCPQRGSNAANQNAPQTYLLNDEG